MSDVYTILCVEDDANLRQLISEELLSAGYRVLEAVDGHAALALMAQQLPDLVLSDVSMPGMGGFELVEAMAAQGGELAQLPFILLTALADSQSQVRGRLLEVDDYLVKPVDFDLLLAAIAAKVKRRRRGDSLPPPPAAPGRALLLAQVAAARTAQASQTLLLVKVDTYLALTMRLAPAEQPLLQHTMLACLAPLAGSGRVFTWSDGCWALLLAEEAAPQAAAVLAQRMTLEVGGVCVAYTCSALCIHLDWQAPALRHFEAATLVESCALHLNFESAGNPRRFIELGRGDYQALQAARHAERYLGQALKSGELTLLFQPRVDLLSGRIVGAEALVRWPHADIGALSPGAFVPAAERSGLATDLDHWVIAQTLEAVTELVSLRPDFILSFNISAQSLGRGVPAFLNAQLQAGRLALAANLEIEVTETSMTYLTAAIEADIAALRALGLKLAVDDFGMGYASLDYLKRLHAEVIKIDRSFVMDISRRSIDARIIEGLISLGRAMGCVVVAEGVESAAQAALLAELGCRFAQGYHFYRPMPLAELLSLLGTP
ncbi:EAL domain-containing protein [Vogesella indigofera]|uniref:EAL domain-containing protein n=1 Tax=Vogesella indigofera TaxID=45465 RepID=UPI003F4380D9